jgi:hypothetical protein
MDWGKIKGGGLLGHRKYGIFVSPDSNLLPMPTPQTCLRSAIDQ